VASVLAQNLKPMRGIQMLDLGRLQGGQQTMTQAVWSRLRGV